MIKDTLQPGISAEGQGVFTTSASFLCMSVDVGAKTFRKNCNYLHHSISWCKVCCWVKSNHLDWRFIPTTIMLPLLTLYRIYLQTDVLPHLTGINNVSIAIKLDHAQYPDHDLLKYDPTQVVKLPEGMPNNPYHFSDDADVFVLMINNMRCLYECILIPLILFIYLCAGEVYRLHISDIRLDK